MAPVMGDIESETIIAVKHISDKEIVESVCHVGAGSPPKPTQLYEKQTSARRRKTVQLQVPTEINGCWTDERKHESDSCLGKPERSNPTQKVDKKHSPAVHSQGPRRKASAGSYGSADVANRSSILLTPDQRRRNTVGTCAAEKSPLLRARSKAMNKTLDSQTASSSNVSQTSQDSLDQPKYDPVRVTTLDIDVGSYSPDPARIDFLRKALSVSPVPFPPEQRKISTGVVKSNKK